MVTKRVEDMNKFLIAGIAVFGLIAFGLFAVIVSLLMDDGGATGKIQAQNTADHVDAEIVTGNAIDQQITDFIHAELNTKTNNDRARIVSVGEQHTKYVIELNGDDNFTAGAIKGQMLMDSVKVFEEVAKHEEIEGNVVVDWYMTVVDTYGNEKESKVLTVELMQETLDKVNWANFDWHNFEEIAVKYEEHPVLK